MHECRPASVKMMINGLAENQASRGGGRKSLDRGVGSLPQREFLMVIFPIASSALHLGRSSMAVFYSKIVLHSRLGPVLAYFHVLAFLVHYVFLSCIKRNDVGVPCW